MNRSAAVWGQFAELRDSEIQLSPPNGSSVGNVTKLFCLNAVGDFIVPTFRTKALSSMSLAAMSLLFLAGCGGSGGGNNTASTSQSSTTLGAPAGWKATDACSLIDKKVVEETLGGTVKSANLGAVKDEGGGFPLYSQCEFLLEDGRMLVFGAGQSTNGEGLDHQLAEMRRQVAMVSKGAPADFPGLGKAALWASDIHALYAFFGDGRFVSATLTQTDFRKKQDSTETVRTQSVAILHKAGA